MRFAGRKLSGESLMIASSLVGRGVDKAAIREASIEGTRRVGLIHLPHPLNYDLWIKIEACPKRVHIRTSYTGSLLAVFDKGGCLKGAGS